jgi:hypothetical protein
LILSWKFSALATDQCVKKSACCQSELTNLSLREVHPVDIEVGADKIANPSYGFNLFQQRLDFRGDLSGTNGALLTVIRKRIFPVIGRQGLCGLA